MNIEELYGLGFARNEALIYQELIRTSPCTASDLLKKTGLHKNGVYYSLRRLMDKGLVSSVMIEGVAQFHVEPADVLLDVIEKKVAELENQRQKALRVTAAIRAVKQTKLGEQQTRVLVGIAGIKQMHKQWLESKKPFVSFGAPAASVEIMGAHYWQNMNLKQQELKVRGKMIFNSSLRSWGAKGFHTYSELRYLDTPFEPLTQTIVFGETVCIIVWSAKPVVTMITDSLVARSYEQFFALLWKNAKK